MAFAFKATCVIPSSLLTIAVIVGIEVAGGDVQQCTLVFKNLPLHTRRLPLMHGVWQQCGSDQFYKTAAGLSVAFISLSGASVTVFLLESYKLRLSGFYLYALL